MEQKYTANVSIVINATSAKIWEALTKPEVVKQYMFGTDMEADWKVGGQIKYKGVWEGKPYEDKGTVLEIQPEKLLISSYFSPLSGMEDKPENYSIIKYEITPEAVGSKLTLTQTNLDKEETAKYMEGNWQKVLDSMKKILETTV
ncbi:MAG: SRPBCC family protein [Candidatus Dojkabacteria bacterium]